MSSKKIASAKKPRKPALALKKRGSRAKPERIKDNLKEILPVAEEVDDSTAIDKDVLDSQPAETELLEDESRFEEIASEDPLELLENPAYSLELSEDPVRLYLREIGQIHLLDANSEFRLATRNEGQKRIQVLENRFEAEKEKKTFHASIFAEIIHDLTDQLPNPD